MIYKIFNNFIPPWGKSLSEYAILVHPFGDPYKLFMKNYFMLFALDYYFTIAKFGMKFN